MLFHRAPISATIDADIMIVEGPLGVDGVPFASAAGAAAARRHTVAHLVALANTVRELARRPLTPAQAPTLEGVDGPFLRCAWCADFIERDDSAYRIRTHLFHTYPCAPQFMAILVTHPERPVSALATEGTPLLRRPWHPARAPEPFEPSVRRPRGQRTRYPLPRSGPARKNGRTASPKLQRTDSKDGGSDQTRSASLTRAPSCAPSAE